MKTIRTSTFETNSSSSHSLTIGTNIEMPKIDYNGEPFVIESGEYGWGYESFTDIFSKICYVAVDAMETGNENLKNWLVEILKDAYHCGDVVFDFTVGCESNKNYTYIDHQSVGTALEAFQSKSDLERFLFSPTSELIINNDNH